MWKKHQKKGQQTVTTPALSALAGFAIILVMIVMTSSIGGQILQKYNDLSLLTNNTVAKNLSTQGLQGLQQFAEFYPILGLVLIGSVIIGLLVAFR